MPNLMREIDPGELGEYPEGHPKHDPGYDCKKFRVITVEMQKAELIAEKKLYNEFVEEPVQEPQKRVWALIPKNNLCIPFKWFDYESDAAVFVLAVARVNNMAIGCAGKSATGRALCSFLDSVLEHCHLRMKKEEDPPNMTLQERRIQTSPCVFSRDLGVKIEKLRDWFEENDPADLRAFELLQPKRQAPHPPKGNGKEMREGTRNSRKRKADPSLPHESIRPKRHRQTGRALPPQRPDDEIKPPRRIAQGKRGKRDWAKLA
ncbi:hypothetical protein INS49_013938 [Diaporthe citri]|uniref:uncharacterized protein n=1 Tax=Diaporthe citri TaxID=83186 RepID=UPI001C80B29C|nr:uncharacterized protein INS49_013938 [Diaporthe citri]KAG6358054.1 hypothetical protein INS49_013938 [Diaporthe citri]